MTPALRLSIPAPAFRPFQNREDLGVAHAVQLLYKRQAPGHSAPARARHVHASLSGLSGGLAQQSRAERGRKKKKMTSVSARPVGVGCYFGGGARCQRRSRVRVSAASVAAPAPPLRAATMYEVLAVEETAGPDEIKAAYRRAARRWHPDACPGGADRFMAAREAYEVLSDPERRRGYDIQLRCGAHFGDAAGYRAARSAGFADWEAQLAGLQWRAAQAERRGRAGGETWGSRMRRAAPHPSSR